MRVVLVCPYAWDRPGGVQSHIRSLAPALAKRGHVVSVVAPLSRRTQEPAPVDTFSTHFLGRVVPIPANGSVAPIAFGPRAATRLKRLLVDLKPDVVHAHEPLIPSLSLLALRASEAPVVATFHAATESSFGYRGAGPWLRAQLARAAKRTVVSGAAHALVSKYFPGDYELTPNGIDFERFSRALPLDLGTKRTILFLGRLEKRKGLEVLIQAIASLRDLDVQLVVAGTGPRERSARSFARRLQIDAKWLGRLDDADVPRIYRAANVYAAPNLGGESFGIVLLEAMATGAPVVASDLEAFRSVAAGAALWATPGDPRSLASALRRALGGGPDIDTQVKAGQARATDYDWARLSEDVERLYEEVAPG